ncbi:Alpha/beta hydrolase fold-3 [Lichtheimia hyalospora FSU 10163]|nr:Alpha/beta hydrolase fold-3 [Lichtheimia hyalospora FSU 10163]
MVTGSKYTYGKFIRDLCIKNHAAIVFPDYAFAPKVQFPHIHEECYSALEWVLAHGKDNLMDPSKLVTCGDSAGGNLTIGISLMAKQRGLPKDTIKAQIPLYPVTDEKREHYPSYQKYSKGDYILTHEEMQFLGKVYHDGVSSNGGDDKWMFPAWASIDDLRDLPPTLFITAETDPLCDEGEEVARKLTEAGVETAAVRILGAVHGYLTLSVVETPVYLQTLAMIKYQLDAAFGRL